MKKRILILAGYYYPSVKAGGPVQSIKNMVESFGDDHDFYILANDRDLGDSKPFENLIQKKWLRVNKAKVYYINYKEITGNLINNIVKKNNIDILYVNSVFDFKISLVPIILYKIKKIKVEKVVIAPRGSLSKGALSFNKHLKMTYLKLSRFLGLYKKVLWHATALEEKKEINTLMGNKSRIVIANNITLNNISDTSSIEQNKDITKFVFLSRIHPKKNLMKALKLLSNITTTIEFNIYGPIENKSYWDECKKVISKLPDNINVYYHGSISNDKVNTVFRNNHFFLFPTLGENYGHVIAESLLNGCPVITSDRTPWNELEKYNAGWSIELNDDDKYLEIIKNCIELKDAEYELMKKNANKYVRSIVSSDDLVKQYKLLF